MGLTGEQDSVCPAKLVVSLCSHHSPCRSKGSFSWELGKNSALALQAADWTKGSSHKGADGRGTVAASGNKKEVAIGLGHLSTGSGQPDDPDLTNR